MPQQTYFINCPYCGQIVEVVGPSVYRSYSKVKADKGEFWFQGESQRNRTGCPACHKDVWLYWYR